MHSSFPVDAPILLVSALVIVGVVVSGVADRFRFPGLVLFLVLFLFYSAYFMLRFSIEEGPRRANISAVYALFGVVLIPISFLAIRLANQLIHPVVFTLQGPQMAGSMFLTFCVSLAAMLTLAATLFHVELAGKRLDARLRELRELLAS